MSAAIKVKLTGGVVEAVSPITLKNTIQADANRRLDSLLDVVGDNANTAAGSTLVYDPDTDRYIVKLLDLDGGSF
jgi:hypothetical protein